MPLALRDLCGRPAPRVAGGLHSPAGLPATLSGHAYGRSVVFADFTAAFTDVCRRAFGRLVVFTGFSVPFLRAVGGFHGLFGRVYGR